MTRLFLLLFGAFIPGVISQNFNVPSTWRKPTLNLSLTELTEIAQSADNSLKPYFNGTDGLSSDFYYFNTIATAYSALARKDRLAGTQSNKWILNAIKTANTTYNGFHIGYSTSTWIGWGIAATEAYKTYGDPDLLQIARNTWNSVAPYQINETQAKVGNHPLKAYAFVSECNNKTIAGGVFANTNLTGHTWLYGQISSYFAQFSVLLADVEVSEGRDNTKYRNAALLSANFLLNQLVDPSSLIMSTLIINGTIACTVSSKTRSENTAHAIEAFAVLADVTGDSKWSDIASTAISNATTTNSWVASDGVVIDDNVLIDDSGREDEWDKIAKGLLLASLYEPWARTRNKALKSYITAFVNVQQNALLDFATSGDSGFYSSNWHGPGATSFTPDGMTAATCLTTTAIAVYDQTIATTPSSSIPSPTPSSPSPSPTEPHKDSLAIPLGAGLGAGVLVLLLALLCLLFLYWRRQNRDLRSTVGPDHEEFNPTTRQRYSALTSTPFVPPTDTQPTLPYTSLPVEPVPMSSPPSTSFPSPLPACVEFATTPNGKETILTWQGHQQSNPTSGSAGTATGHGVITQAPGGEMPTVNLVRILNDRVSHGYEPQGDGPPAYLENNQ